MIYIQLNAIAILAATLAGLGFGALYLQLSGLTRRGTGFYLTTFIAQAWFCAILAGALILAPAKGDAWTMAIGSAVVIWAGFVAPATIVSLSARRVGPTAIGLECAYWLGVMLIQAFVLKSIGLIAPPA